MRFVQSQTQISFGPHASSIVPINSRKYGIVLLYGIWDVSPS